ncbi:hypothetical protein [Rhodobacteraceae bacterium DSL-40]|uniref:hypothetical protein n=1 Tax=Amaricoccus sp. B4 TaxID=3368557 RepID=UPI000DAEC101
METTEHDQTTGPRADTLSGRENIKETGREALSAARERVDAAGTEARSMLDDAVGAAQQQTEAAKGHTAHEIRRTAEGLEAAARELQDSPLQHDLLNEAAEGLQQISRAVDGKSISRMSADLSDFARSNPVAFLGGAALTGFALARFARAGDPRSATSGYTADGHAAGAAHAGYSTSPRATEPAFGSNPGRENPSRGPEAASTSTLPGAGVSAPKPAPKPDPTIGTNVPAASSVGITEQGHPPVKPGV